MPKRTDANHVEIMWALRSVGAAVLDLSQVGHGVPDGSSGGRYLGEYAIEKEVT